MADNDDVMVCIICHKGISEDDEQYACVWINGDDGLEVGFSHMVCSEGMKDITDEVKGVS